MSKKSKGMKVVGCARMWANTCMGSGRMHIDWEMLELYERSTGKPAVYEADLYEWARSPKGQRAIANLEKRYARGEITRSDHARRLRAWRKTHEYASPFGRAP